MQVTTTHLPDVLILTPKCIKDERGWFMESFNQQTFQQATGVSPTFVQDNHSHSTQGVLRGLHYQLPPTAQGKLVRVLQGKTWDVAVDLRRTSATFGQWVGVELSAENQQQLWVPAGFAHGFITLSASAELAYKTTDYYAPVYERTLLWNDPTLSIAWPITPVQLSAKDQQGCAFSQAEVFA